MQVSFKLISVIKRMMEFPNYTRAPSCDRTTSTCNLKEKIYTAVPTLSGCDHNTYIATIHHLALTIKPELRIAVHNYRGCLIKPVLFTPPGCIAVHMCTYRGCSLSRNKASSVHSTYKYSSTHLRMFFLSEH